MKDFRDKVIAVTGAGSGMGRDMAVQLARRGAKVAISDVDPDGLATTERLVKEAGGDVHSQILNVAEREAVLAWADTVNEHFGSVNAVINNAGIAHNGEVETMEFKDIERIMDVDYWGVVNGTKAFLPYVIASGDGAIVNVSSIFGIAAEPGQAAYNGAKFAVRGFTESLRQEMLISDHKVAVTCVHPGGIKTAIARNATSSGDLDSTTAAAFFDKYLARTSSPKAAQIILRAVEKERARVLVGPDAKFIDFSVRLLGSGYQAVSARIMKWGTAYASKHGK
ncbi:MAG: SDR family NAD(P)-dependent oxidoreductase [Gordonia sp. (in: high G+C Gram-positive bacteria)]